MEVSEFTAVTGKIIFNMRCIRYLLIGLLVAGCSNLSSKKDGPAETAITGRINISVDESFKPVISEQIKVFESSHPEAHIIAAYKSEADCFRDLQTDSTRLVIVSRGLSGQELTQYKTRLEFKPLYDLLAYDAIAVVLNTANNDSVFTLNELKAMLAGENKNRYNAVVDGKNATSTVRYLIDSVLNGKPLGSNVTAAKNSADVITYVSENAGAIGFVGASWLADNDDKEMKTSLSKVKMALIECKSCEKDVFAKPSQETIMHAQYPLVRGLHYILKENWSGLGTGLINFMSLERGQLIFRRSYLVPGQMQFNRRKTRINKSE